MLGLGADRKIRRGGQSRGLCQSPCVSPRCGDIMAACGQLKSASIKQPLLVSASLRLSSTVLRVVPPHHPHHLPRPLGPTRVRLRLRGDAWRGVTARRAMGWRPSFADNPGPCRRFRLGWALRFFAFTVVPALTIVPALVARIGDGAAHPLLDDLRAWPRRPRRVTPRRHSWRARHSADLLVALPAHQYMTIFAAAGFLGGFVYWLLAGRNA